MISLGIFPKRSDAKGKSYDGSESTAREKCNGNTDKKVPYEVDLHVPCRVAGITRDGSRWEGEAVTTSISSFGAHLALPWNTELEGDVSLIFKIPASLRILFRNKAFHAAARIMPSGASVVMELASLKRRIVYVSFAEPIFFRLC